MVPERDVDPAAIYETERCTFVELVRSLSPERFATTVPATPSWSVHDVLAHVVAITADLNAQRFGDGDGDAWTAAQVEARRNRSVDELAAEWDREAPTFEDGLRLFGYDFGAHYLGDLLQHVGDVRSAVGATAARDDLALTVALDFYLASLEETLVSEGVGAVEVVAGEPDGDRERFVLGDGDVVVAVRGSRWELFRSLGGRRTRVEVRALDWSGDAADIERVVDLTSRYPVPETSLSEC